MGGLCFALTRISDTDIGASDFDNFFNSLSFIWILSLLTDLTNSSSFSRRRPVILLSESIPGIELVVLIFV
jgi:hypothetical protein